MKIKPAVLVGVLFVALFVIVAYVFQAFGVWDPPGVKLGSESGHSDDGEHSEEYKNDEYSGDGVYLSDSLEGSMDLHDFLEEKGVSIDCVSGKLGIQNRETKKSAKDIKAKLGLEMSDIRAIIDECMGLDPRPDPHAEEIEPEHKEEIIENDDHDNDETVVYENPDNDSEHENVSDLPQLMGSDNVKEYCEANDISLECVSDKLGVSIDELNTNGGSLKDVAGLEMHDIRDLITGCK